jgi:IPT/TIG domain
MNKRLLAAIISVVLFGSPLVALAQTANASPSGNSDAQLIAELTQLVQLLEQELQQLIIAHGGSSVSFTASPTSGSAPLSVSFSASGGQNLPGDTVNFGDGTSGTLTANPVPEYACPQLIGTGINSNCQNPVPTYSVAHTYQSAGTYTATLTSGPCACPASGACNCPNMQVLGSAMVVVSGTTQATPVISSLSPGSGPVGIVMTITGSGFTPTGDQIWCMTGCSYSPGAISNATDLSSNGTTISYAVPGSPAATYTIAVVNSNGTSNSETFTVTPPTITSLSPSSGPVGTQLTITGTGFTPNDNNQLWCMTGCSYSPGAVPGLISASSNSTSLTYTIPTSPVGIYTIAVVNGQGNTTNSETFTVTSGN